MLDLPRVLAVLGLLLWIVAQYGLIALALRDLRRRPAVRGGNKVAWALVVLAVPIVGPLLYAAVHPGMWPTAPARHRRSRGRSAVRSRPPLSSDTCPPDICPPDTDPDPDSAPGTAAPPSFGPASSANRVRLLDRVRRAG